MPDWVWAAIGLTVMAIISARAILQRRQENRRPDRGRWASWADEPGTSSLNDRSDEGL